MNPKILTIRTSIGVYVFWGIMTLIPVALVLLVPNPAETPSDGIGIALFISVLILLFGLTQVLHKIALTNDSLRFQDIVAHTKIGKRITVPLANIKLIYVGYPGFIEKQLRQDSVSPAKLVGATLVTGAISSAGASATASSRVKPKLIMVTGDDQLLGTTLAPYSKASCQQLIVSLQAQGVDVQVQKNLL